MNENSFLFSTTIKGIYKNIKNGNLYTLLDENLINTTNANDGQRMCLYTNKEFTLLFTREYTEFHEKFIKIENKG